MYGSWVKEGGMERLICTNTRIPRLIPIFIERNIISPIHPIMKPEVIPDFRRVWWNECGNNVAGVLVDGCGLMEGYVKSSSELFWDLAMD